MPILSSFRVWVSTSSPFRGLILLLACVGASQLFGQERSPVSYESEVLFGDAVGLYDSLRFKDAATAFDLVLKLYPASHRTTAAHIMKAKSLYHLGENLESAKSLEAFLSAYDSSAYCADAHLTLGLIYRRIGRPVDAFQQVVLAQQRVPPSRPFRLLRAIASSLDSLTLFELSPADLRAVLNRALTPDIVAYVRLKGVEREWRAGDTRAARLALDTLVALMPAMDSADAVIRMRRTLSQPRQLRLAAVLPLGLKGGESQLREIGGEVYDGIVYAVEEFVRDTASSVKVGLVTRDTDRDTTTAYRVVRELSADSTIVGIVGPIYTATTLAAAKAAQEGRMPLVTPTATGNGIGAMGEYVFQANPDNEMRGRAMAKYAVNRLGYQYLAVLAPSSQLGRLLGEGFITEASRLGARVVAIEWYEKGASVLRSQLAAIRRAGAVLNAEPYLSFAAKRKRTELQKLVAMGIPMNRLDSLMHRAAIVKATSLLGPRAKVRLDSAGVAMVYRESALDTIDVPMENIQGIYLPISSPEEIGVVSSQLAYFNIRSQILGSGEWNSLKDLDANKRYCAGVVFESDSYADPAGIAFKRLADGFSARFKKQPSKYSLYGYDATMMCLSLLREGAVTRESMREGLARVRAFQGIHAKLGFTSGRVNSWLGIMRFDGALVQYIDEIQVE